MRGLQHMGRFECGSLGGSSDFASSNTILEPRALLSFQIQVQIQVEKNRRIDAVGRSEPNEFQ